MVTRRFTILGSTVFILLLLGWYRSEVIDQATSLGHVVSHVQTQTPISSPSNNNNGKSETPKHVLTYFDQVFSPGPPPTYDFPALTHVCSARKEWEDDIYIRCGAMSAGLTSIMSQVKVCLKMAVDAGVNVILPAMPLRDSTDLTNFNFFNADAYLVYDGWFDAAHLVKSFGQACPRMKILHPDVLGKEVKVKNNWNVDLGKTAPGYVQFQSYFWAGRPFSVYFAERLEQLRKENPPKAGDMEKGITEVTIAAAFLLFRITDDPTGGDLRVWKDLSHLIRFNEAPRQIVSSLLGKMDRDFYGVHFRAENDTIWSSPDHQLAVDLDALDRAWAKYGTSSVQKPLVYLACGDQAQIAKFVAAGKERGWEVTHKWALAEADASTLKAIDELPFDFQGAVDMGLMVRAGFFLGITGSALSSSVANARDATGRYRGSSFVVGDDGEAKTHLFNDGDAGHYACCL